jgi:hypothetical protein
MPSQPLFPWKRFWCRRESTYSLGDRGFLYDPESEHGNIVNPNLTSFDELQSVPCLALLGEPGIGKSWSLSAEVDAYLRQSPDTQTIRIDLRSFGSEDRLCRALFQQESFIQWLKGNYDLHLYIDSLDECLLRIDSVAALLADGLPAYPLTRLKLRIACRTASWPRLLENALEAAYGQEQFVATELVPLRRADVALAAKLHGIPNAYAFLTRVDELGIASLAIKPITLKMLLDTFQRNGDLPDNIIDLYEKGCSTLCEEQNESRRAAHRTGSLSPNDRIAVASRIAAATQFGNRFAVWTGTEAAGVPQEDVSVGELIGGTEPAGGPLSITFEAVLETLDTGLFNSRGQERLGWSHQTLAEFLAARYCIKHELPIQQIRSLVFHPRRGRVIPQVREVASWIALQNLQLFAEIAESDPEVLLGAAAPNLSNQQREIATDALLKSCDHGQFLHIKHNLEVRNLSHPGLAEQLRAALTDQERSVSARCLAVNIARTCAVEGLGDLLAEIALSNAEAHDLRTSAAYAVAELGSEVDRSRLQPLLGATRDVDPDDQLRGAALQAIYPNQKYDDEMWGYLEPPRRALFFGAYDSFLTSSVSPKLNAKNLPAALRWCAKYESDESGPIHELQGEIFSLAVEHIEAAGVADLLAGAVLEWAKSFRKMPHRRNSKDFSETLANDLVRRRRFLETLLPLLNRSNVYLVTFSLSLAFKDDLQWLIDRIVSGTSPSSATVEALLICRLASSWDPSVINAVWQACHCSPVLAEECKGLFEPVSLDLAPPRQKTYADLLKERNIEIAPALQPRCEAVVQLSERGDADAWLRLLFEMSLDEGGTHYMDLRQMEVEKLPGWTGASEDMKSRMIVAAKVFLMQTTVRESVWFPSTQIPYGASAGVNALAFLYSLDLPYLQKQSADFWVPWIPALIGDSRAGHDNNKTIDSVFRLAICSAPALTNARLIEQIQFESNDRQLFFGSSLVDIAWSELLGLALLAKLQQNDLATGVQGEILYKLISRRIPGAKRWAEETIHGEHTSERGIAISEALLKASDDAGWSTLWPIIKCDVEFGRRLLEDVSFGQPDRASFTTCLNDAELGELYTWVLEQYPPQDHLVSGFMGPRDTIRFLRDGLLEQLKKRSTFEACDAISRAELRLPRHRWLRYHFDQAELMACASTWEAQSPHDIIAIASDRQKRFVESSGQLLDVILDSLSRLQAELHGELASVCDLWNSRNAHWWPKQEEDVSDYVARHLKRDLTDRGIIFNREVQIRRSRRGEMPGQNTDIHVDAIPAEGTKAQLYGPINVVIEVKGSWNDGLSKDMEVQLRDRYMKNSECRTGLYVVAHFKADSWIGDDARRTKSNTLEIQVLRNQLAEQAAALSGSVLIRSFVLDCSLDSTSATLG